MFKKLSKFAAAFMAASVLLLAGCSNFTAEEALVDGIKNAGSKCVVNIGIGGVKDDVARTILPTAWTTAEAASFKFKISGTSSRGETLAPTELTFTSGTAQLSLSYSLWELTLIAYKDAAFAEPVLQGNTFIDLTNGGSTISFILSSAGISTPGGISLGGTYTDTESVVKKIEMGLYRFDNGALVGSVTTLSGTQCDGTFSFTGASVTPGTYTFAMKFYIISSAAGVTPIVYSQVGYWSDMVIIAAGKTTTKTDIEIPDIIYSKPTAPENLKAYLVNDSETSTGSYNVKLTWEDKSSNEENFVITVREYASQDDASPTIFKIFGKEDGENLPTPDPDKEVFWGSQYRAAGSILAGNTTCTLTLPTGRLFDIAIQSQNYAGLSDEVTRVAGGTETGCTAYGAAPEKINRVMMTYVLNGGKLEKSAAVNYSSVNYIEYKTYTGSNFKVYGYDMSDAGGATPPYELKTNSETTDTTTYPILRRGNHPFQKWLDTVDGSEIKESTDFHNLTVIADYNLTYLINYTIVGYTDMAEARVTATYDAKHASDPGSSNVNCKNDTILAGSSQGVDANPPITFTVTDAASGEVEYDSYQIKIDDMIIYSGISNTFTYTSANVTLLDSGTHTVNVFAKKKNTSEWYSNTFAITISR